MKRLPREIGLQLRMALAATVALLLLLVVLLFFVALARNPITLLVALGPIVFTLGGALIASKAATSSWDSRPAYDDDRERAGAVLTRLALIADVRPPRVVVDGNKAPLSWTTAIPRRTATIHLTTGLLDRVDDRGLQAVLAHELAHVLHRDAVFVTLLAGPPAYLLGGIRVAGGESTAAFFGMLLFGVFLLPPAALILAIARVVSRNRELVADRAAAVLTGSPESVAAALLTVETHLGASPKRDLRAAALRDDFNFVPARPARWLLRPWATHPRTEKRVARLERFAAAMARSS